MSERDDTTGGREPAEGSAWARVYNGSWSGWIWSVPLAALIVAGYLGTRALLLAGPSVTVSFPTAAGVTATGETPVLYRGLQVGTVSAVELQEDLAGVVMHLSMDRAVSDSLRTGTRFWVEQPDLLGGDFSQLLAGPHLVMEPGTGEPTHHFEGLAAPPLDEAFGAGRGFVLVASRAGSLSRGSPVVYHGLDAGRVLGLSLGSTPDEVRIHVVVRPPYDRLVHADSRFWRCGGAGLSTAAGGMDVRIPSLRELLSGCVAFDSGGDTTGAAGSAGAASGQSFPLYASADAARSRLSGRGVRFVAEFPGSVEGLEPGAAVEMRGVRVGEVADVVLRVRPESGEIRTPVALDLYPQRLGLEPLGPDGSPQPLYDAVDRLVRKGLRAQLTPSSLVLGGESASLVMTDGTGEGLDLSQRPPRIPAIAGGDLKSAVASIARASNALASLPLESLGRNLRDVSQQLDRLARSPELEQSLDRLDRVVASVDTLTTEARREMGPALADLRRAVQDLASTTEALQGVTGGSLQNQQSLKDLVEELTRAARSIRTLTDYLDRHPEALIEGRSSP